MHKSEGEIKAVVSFPFIRIFIQQIFVSYIALLWIPAGLDLDIALASTPLFLFAFSMTHQ